MAGPIKPSKKIEKAGAGKAAVPPATAPVTQGSTAVAAALVAESAKVAATLPAEATKTVVAAAKAAGSATPAPAKPPVSKPKPAAEPKPVQQAKPAGQTPPAKPVAAAPDAAAPEPSRPAPPEAKPATTSPSPSPATEKGTIDMATAADTFTTAANTATDKAQSMFADAQSRTKSAWEKSARFYEEMGEFAKGNVEALIASSKVATGALESMGQDAVAYGRKSAEEMTAAAKSMAAVKSPTELFQLQSDYARKAIDDYVAESAKVSEKLVKLATDMSQPLSSRFALAAEKVKSASL